MVFRIADNSDADAEAISNGAFGDRVGCVIGALGMDVGAKLLEQLFHVGLGENDHVIHDAKGGDQESAGVFVEDGAAGAFERADAGIGVDADDEEVSLFLCAGEITNVANVQGIEAAVGEDDGLPAIAFGGQALEKSFTGDDFGVGGAHRQLGVGSRGGGANGFEEFGTGNGGGAAFHDHEAAGNVSEMSGFQRRGIAGEAEGVGGKNGVPGAGDVYGLVSAMNGDVRGRLAGLKESEAVASAGDDEGLELHLREGRASTAFEFGEILSDGGVVERFHFAFVGRGGVQARAGVSGEAIAGVERGDEALLAGEELGEFGGNDNAEAVVRDGEGVGVFEGFCQFGIDFPMDIGGEIMIGLVVHAEDLLADFVGPASQEAGLGWRGPVLDAEDSGDVEPLGVEEAEKALAGVIVADGGDGKNLGAKSGEIIGSVCSAARDDLRFAMLQDEDRGLARDASDVADLEGVGNEIAEDNDGFGGEAFDVFGEGKKIDGGGRGRFGRRTLHEGSLNGL